MSNKIHPRHRLFLLLSKVHGRSRAEELIEVDDDKASIFDLHDLESEKEIEAINKELALLKQKVRQKMITGP